MPKTWSHQGQMLKSAAHHIDSHNRIYSFPVIFWALCRCWKNFSKPRNWKEDFIAKNKKQINEILSVPRTDRELITKPILWQCWNVQRKTNYWIIIICIWNETKCAFDQDANFIWNPSEKKWEINAVFIGREVLCVVHFGGQVNQNGI